MSGFAGALSGGGSRWCFAAPGRRRGHDGGSRSTCRSGTARRKEKPPTVRTARPGAYGNSDRRGSEALARPRSPDGAAPPRQHHPQRDGQDRACPPRRPSPLLPRPPSLGEMPQTSRTREVQIDPTRPPGDVEPPRGPARPAPEPRPGPHPHTPPCDLDDACRKTRKVTLTCGSGSSPQCP